MNENSSSNKPFDDLVEEVKALETIAQKALEHLNRKASPNSIKPSYSNTPLFEIQSRISALEQMIGELTYYLGFQFNEKVDWKDSYTTFAAQDTFMFWSILQKSTYPAQILLDLGCGVRPTNLFLPNIHICVDLFQPYLDFLKNKFEGENILLICDEVVAFLKRQPSSSIDTIFIADLIEHLDREEGMELIQEVTRVASVQVIIFTPNGFMEQHVGPTAGDGWGWVGNTAQTHLSGWTPSDFPGWKILTSPNHHKEIGYEPGAFAAIFRKEQVNFEKSIYVICPTDSMQAQKILINFQLGLSSLGDQFTVRALIHPGLALGSFNIEAVFARQNWDINVSTFNPEIRRVSGMGKEANIGSSLGIFGFMEQILEIYDFKSDLYIVGDSSAMASDILTELTSSDIDEKKIHIITN